MRLLGTTTSETRDLDSGKKRKVKNERWTMIYPVLFIVVVIAFGFSWIF